jgi:hypothetical protein
LTEGNEDHQDWAWVEPGLSYLRYLLFRTSSLPSVLVVPAIRGDPRNPWFSRFNTSLAAEALAQEATLNESTRRSQLSA